MASTSRRNCPPPQGCGRSARRASHCFPYNSTIVSLHDPSQELAFVRLALAWRRSKWQMNEGASLAAYFPAPTADWFGCNFAPWGINPHRNQPVADWRNAVCCCHAALCPPFATKSRQTRGVEPHRFRLPFCRTACGLFCSCKLEP